MIEHRGEKFSGYNKPKRTPGHKTKSHAVLAKEGSTVKLIRFGQQGVSGAGSNPKSKSEKNRRKSFKARHAKNIKKGKMSAAYWANRTKWWCCLVTIGYSDFTHCINFCNFFYNTVSDDDCHTKHWNHWGNWWPEVESNHRHTDFQSGCSVNFKNNFNEIVLTAFIVCCLVMIAYINN